MKRAILFTPLMFVMINTLGQQTNWGVKFSDAIIDRYQPTIDVMTHHGWDHSNSIILHGMEKVYARTNNPKYFKYIKTFVDSFVDKKGNVTGLRPALDGMHPGVLLLFMYEKTGDARYKTAAMNMRNYLLGTSNSPSPFNKTPEGGYWHSQSEANKNVMSVDGIYMAQPFLVKYGKIFNDKECFDVATFQTLLAASHSFNITTKLPYHGWDYSKSKSWANPITGTSSQPWSRSTGWFSMALVDILENLPSSHPDYKAILFLFQQLAEGIRENQHPVNGYWYHILNKQEVLGNYPESSSTGMITYSIMKGVDLGLLDKSYESVALNGWKGLQGFISTHSDGKPQINSFTPGMGCKNDLEDYLSVRPVSCPAPSGTQHPHGYCALLMAASVMER